MTVDVRDVLERADLHSLILLDTQLRKVGKELHGPCPFCSCSNGTRKHQCDRFRLSAERRHWFCRQCTPDGGNAIDFCVKRYQVSFKQACMIALGGERPVLAPRIRQRASEAAALPSRSWQQRGLQLVQDAVAALWDPEVGARPRAYLASRGLWPSTLDAWAIGYNAADVRLAGSEWGLDKDVFVPRGIVVPWFNRSGVLTGLKIRRPMPSSARGKYVSVAGSTYRLYGLPTLVVDEPLVLVEGEFDALAAWQRLGDYAACVALGTARVPDQGEMRALNMARPVLVALDADDTGDRTAAQIVGLSPNCRRVRPQPAKDLADCVASGADLGAWFEAALAAQEETDA